LGTYQDIAPIIPTRPPLGRAKFAGPNSFFSYMLPQEPLFSFAGERIRLACRPRDTHTVRNLQRQSDGRLQADPVALRHINRPHSLSRPHHGSNSLSLCPPVHYWRPATRLFSSSPCVPTSRLLAQPIVGRSSSTPQMACQPNRRGCAYPCPSQNNRSGSFRSFRKAASSAGISRKLSSREYTEIAMAPPRSPAQPLPFPESGTSPRSLSPGWPPATHSIGPCDSSAPASL